MRDWQESEHAFPREKAIFQREKVLPQRERMTSLEGKMPLSEENYVALRVKKVILPSMAY
jgi:hypothetical protein